MKRLMMAILISLMVACSCCNAADLSGMWWDATKPGTGVYIDYEEGGAGVCGSWYLYDDRGNPYWVTFMGRAENNVLNASLYRFSGPAMGQAWDNSAVRFETVGSVTIDFSNPDSLAMTYELDRITGSLNLTKFSNDKCQGSLWWDVNKQGQGVAHFHFTDPSGQDKSALVWYVYDANGDSVWYTAVGGADAEAFNALHFTGPSLEDNWDTSLVQNTSAGTITAAFNTNTFQTSRMPQINMAFDIGGITGSLNLQPFECPVAVPKK